MLSALEERLEYVTATLRFSYSSMTTPWETYDYDLTTRERVLRKRQIIPSGSRPVAICDTAAFRARSRRRIGAGLDSLPRRSGVGRLRPLLLYGYGAYGSHVPASFSANRLALSIAVSSMRSRMFAAAPTRAGTGTLTENSSKKPNSFTDFISAARHLIARGLHARRADRRGGRQRGRHADGRRRQSRARAVRGRHRGRAFCRCLEHDARRGACR